MLITILLLLTQKCTYPLKHMPFILLNGHDIPISCCLDHLKAPSRSLQIRRTWSSTTSPIEWPRRTGMSRHDGRSRFGATEPWTVTENAQSGWILQWKTWGIRVTITYYNCCSRKIAFGSWGMDCFHKWGGTCKMDQNGWFIMENPIKTDDLGVPLFRDTSIYNGSMGCIYKIYWLMLLSYIFTLLSEKAKLLTRHSAVWCSKCLFDFGQTLVNHFNFLLANGTFRSQV